MKYTKKIVSLAAAISTVALMVACVVVPAPHDTAQAQGWSPFGPSVTGGVTDAQLGIGYGAATGLSKQDPRLTAAYIIRASIGVLGMLAVVIIVIAGYMWMTAGGNEEKVAEAKKWIYAGVIGLAIILSAYSIASFVVANMVAATTGGNPDGTINLQIP